MVRGEVCPVATGLVAAPGNSTCLCCTGMEGGAYDFGQLRCCGARNRIDRNGARQIDKQLFLCPTMKRCQWLDRCKLSRGKSCADEHS